jgi:hypothetical protein
MVRFDDFKIIEFEIRNVGTRNLFSNRLSYQIPINSNNMFIYLKYTGIPVGTIPGILFFYHFSCVIILHEKKSSTIEHHPKKY